jgi:glycosyltransferase involved in cell wall biosynthesis
LRIGFDASVIFSSVGGTRTYAVQLLSSLIDLKNEWEFFLYTRDEAQAVELRRMWPHGSVHVSAVSGSPNTLRVQRSLPAALRRDRIDLYHSLGYFLPLRWRGPKVVTVHDMNVYVNWRQWLRPRKFVNWADMAVQVPLAVGAARQVITDSTSSMQLVERILRVSPGKITVVHLAPDPFFDAQPSEKELGDATALTGATRYVLFVGIISAQKNLGLLVRAFAAAGLGAKGVRLVLAGSDREREGEALRRLAGTLGVEERVVLTGYVSQETLRALYHDALVVVLPSHGEGFGLPLVEAMACGAPVLAARTQSLPEVVGDGGGLFDPDDVSGLAALLRRVDEDRAFREELVQRGTRRRADFSWEAAAKATAEVYEAVASSSR